PLRTRASFLRFRGARTERVIMPRYARLASVLPFLLLLLLLMPASLAARDEVSYGRYLGVRLRMYEESYAVLDRVIASAKGDAQARAKQVKAEVIKSEADNKFAEDGDVQARVDRYKAAIEVFGSPTEPAGALAKGRLLLDVAADLRRLEPRLARDYCDQA